MKVPSRLNALAEPSAADRVARAAHTPLAADSAESAKICATSPLLASEPVRDNSQDQGLPPVSRKECSMPTQSSAPAQLPRPLLRIPNHHVDSCGDPPDLIREARHNYLGYFENPYGEQWVFTF